MANEADEEKFQADRCSSAVRGIEYIYEEAFGLGRVKWPLEEPMMIRVQKPGGLSQGNHAVSGFILKLRPMARAIGERLMRSVPAMAIRSPSDLPGI